MINEMIRESAYPAMGCMALASCKLTLDTARHGRKSRNALVPPHLSPITYQL